MLEKIKKNYFLLTATFLVLYFFFNLLEGERGLFSNFKKKNILISLQNKESVLTQCAALGLVVCKIVEYFDCFEKSNA